MEENNSVNFSESDMENEKCKRCHEFWSVKNREHCSQCQFSIDNNYNASNMTVKEILELPSCHFKSECMQLHLVKFFDLFKGATKIKHTIITNPTEFHLLLTLCRGLKPDKIHHTLNGKLDFKPCILPAKYANQLLDECMNGDIESEKYKYIHAIGPFILDPWNMPNANNVFVCYYKEAGNLTKCQNNHESLFGMWKRHLIHNTSLTKM